MAQEDEFPEAPQRHLSLSRFHTAPMASPSLMSSQSFTNRTVEVGFSFFKEAAEAKDKVIDLERELEQREEQVKELLEDMERARDKAEGAVLKQKALQKQFDEAQKALEDYRTLNQGLHLRCSEANAMHDAMGAQIASLTTELSAARATEGELRHELRRALREEERIGSHVDLMASEKELKQAKDALRLKEEEIKALQVQLLEQRKQIVAAKEPMEVEQAESQCRDCGELQQVYESQLRFSMMQQEELEKALSESLAQQEALRWSLLQERRQHEDLKAEHNEKMTEAREETTFLRAALGRQKEGRWRQPKVKEQPMEANTIPWSSPLWTPSPETKLRLQELLPDVRSKAHHLYPKPATAR